MEGKFSFFKKEKKGISIDLAAEIPTGKNKIRNFSHRQVLCVCLSVRRETTVSKRLIISKFL